VRLRLASDQLDSEPLARTWAAAFVQALRLALAQPTGASAVEVVRAESRAAWLAMVISDLLVGTAAQHWEYEEFQAYFGLRTAEAVLTLLSQEPSEAVPTLAELEAHGRLDRLLAVCDDLALEQLFEVIAHGHGGATESRLSVQDVLTVGQLALSHAASLGRAGLASREQALRLFLALIHAPGWQRSPRWSPRRVWHALTALEVLAELTRPDESTEWGPAFAMLSPVERLGRSLPAVVLGVLEEVRTLVQPHAHLHRSVSTPPLLTEVAEVLRGLRSLVPSATRDVGAGARWISSDCAGLFLLVGLLARWGWPRSLLQSTLGALHGPRAITYGLAGLGLALLARASEVPSQLDPGLALFAGWLEAPDLAGLRRFFAAGSAAERRELLSTLIGEVASHAGPSETWPATFKSLADYVLREFAGRVRGFRRASPAFIVKHFLALPGRIRVEEGRLCVCLDTSPFHVALHLSGMDEAVEAVSWLGGRRVEFQLAGL
jgi:hypothetical protein